MTKEGYKRPDIGKQIPNFACGCHLWMNLRHKKGKSAGCYSPNNLGRNAFAPSRIGKRGGQTASKKSRQRRRTRLGAHVNYVSRWRLSSNWHRSRNLSRFQLGCEKAVGPIFCRRRLGRWLFVRTNSLGKEGTKKRADLSVRPTSDGRTDGQRSARRAPMPKCPQYRPRSQSVVLGHGYGLA